MRFRVLRGRTASRLVHGLALVVDGKGVAGRTVGGNTNVLLGHDEGWVGLHDDASWIRCFLRGMEGSNALHER